MNMPVKIASNVAGILLIFPLPSAENESAIK